MLCQLFLLYLISTRKRSYPVIVSANARAASQLLSDIHRMVMEPETAFSQDYPTLVLPFQIANGSNRRRMTYDGRQIGVAKTASDMSFADIKIDGQPGLSHISARGLTGGLRGMRKGSIRPDFILLDDLLGEDDVSDEATNKILDIIRKSVLNLGGQDRKLPCAMTSTSIAADDVTQRLKQDKNWSTLVFP